MDVATCSNSQFNPSLSVHSIQVQVLYWTVTPYNSTVITRVITTSVLILLCHVLCVTCYVSCVVCLVLCVKFYETVVVISLEQKWKQS